MASTTAVVQANFKIGDDLYNIYADNTAQLLAHLLEMASMAAEIATLTTSIKSGRSVNYTIPGGDIPAVQLGTAPAQAPAQVAYSSPQGGAPTWVTQPPHNTPVAVSGQALDHEGNPLPGWVRPCTHASPENPMRLVSKITNGKKWTAYGCPTEKDTPGNHGLQFAPR